MVGGAAGTATAGSASVAADALALPEYYEAPPVICYLDRGIGGAIRRARTRMPGGGENPVAVIRIPRERMILGKEANQRTNPVRLRDHVDFEPNGALVAGESGAQPPEIPGQ